MEAKRDYPLRFIHLSDIHFAKPKILPKYELDTDLRNELIRDAAIVREKLGAPDAILITGDISYSAGRSEFDQAWTWIRETLCPTVACPTEGVLCVPGNHDVDWQCIKVSKPIRDCHKNIRSCTPKQVSAALAEYLKDDWVFYRALEEYNGFSLRFGCQMSVTEPNWVKAFDLNDGSTLSVVGLNSTLISDDNDNDKQNRLALGEHQFTLPTRDGNEYLTLCHHPPSWLIDGDQAEHTLIQRAKIHLFGHKHKLRMRKIENSVQVVAGAVHPQREEDDWEPRYNWITVQVAKAETGRTLRVEVFPRVWSEEHKKFQADFDTCEGTDSKGYELSLLAWTPPKQKEAKSKGQVPVVEVGKVDDHTTEGIVARPAVDPARTLAQRFLSLPIFERLRIAKDLGLLMETDDALTDREKYLQFFKRASERQILGKVWSEVRSALGDESNTKNPFES